MSKLGTRRLGRTGWVARLGLLSLLVSGCTTNTITNMTPRLAVRHPDQLYPIEVRWDSNQRTVRNDSLQPYVVVGEAFYPMQRTPLVTNRWEAEVPVPPGQRFVNYRFKFDYLFDAFGKPKRDSKLSPTYQLEIVEDPQAPRK